MKLKNIVGFKRDNKKSRIIMLLGAMVVLITLLTTAILLARALLNGPYVYHGVYLDGIHMGGLDESDLQEYLARKYDKTISTMELNIFHKEYPLIVSFAELDVQISQENMFKKIYLPGRQGNFIKRLYEIHKLRKKHLYLETDVTVDMRALNKIIDDIDDKTYVSQAPPALVLLEDEAYIRSGSVGQRIDRETLKTRILNQINQLESGIVIVPVVEIHPAKINADSFYSQIVCEPQDAMLERVNGEWKITPEIVGRVLDKASLLSAVAVLEEKSGRYPVEIKLPVEFVKPDVTVEIIHDSLFRDVLSTCGTTFPVDTENNQNRAVNIQLAVNSINGAILMPGEVFSFNGTVGKRTTAKGYKIANIYTSNGITPGIGGGICQVSSTLYNAALEANLKITERNPHIYRVAYVPLGRDAAVSYGTEDFCFLNNTRWPIQIEGRLTNGNRIEFIMHGTNENPGLKVTILPTVQKTIPFPTEYIADTSIEDGNQIVIQAGMEGAVVDTFFKLKNEQRVINSYKLHTTTYKPLPEIIAVSPKNKP